MSMILTGAAAAPLAERKDDLYETPECAVRALLAVESLPHVVWEPACGPGAIVKVLRDAGHKVYATDLVTYGCPDSEGRIDFLMEGRPPADVGAVVTNPPYKLAEEFVRHPQGGYAAAAGVPGGRGTPVDPTGRPIGAGVCVPATPADDAQGWLDRPKIDQRHCVCMVRMGLGTPRGTGIVVALTDI